jgi:putative colanic acid biosynthesis acetyltransferase WcaF
LFYTPVLPLANEFIMQLNQYTVGDYTPGASLVKQLLWFFVGAPLVETSLLPVSSIKVWLLRCFGAEIGQGVRIKPGVKIKFPWRLTVGNDCWLGENSWLDNVAPIVLEHDICLSQGVYLCTGNHDWNHPHFQLRPAPIHIGSGSWIAAKAIIGPGVVVGKGAVLCLGSVANHSLETMTIYAGNPARPIKRRTSMLTPV